MQTIGDLYRIYSCVVNNGSGCLFQPKSSEYTFILTVKHNLIKESASSTYYPREELKISRTFEKFKNKIYLNVVDMYVHETKDYAIIKVQKINELKENDLLLGKFEKDMEVIISGFPNYMRTKENESKDIRTSLKATVENEKATKYEIDLTLHEKADGSDSSAKENIIGFSGSGIFYEIKEELYLGGIFPKLNDSQAAHNKVVGFDLSGFEDIIKENDLFNPAEMKPSFNVKRFLRKSWKNLALGILLPIFFFAIYSFLFARPKCENFTNQSDLNVLITEEDKRGESGSEKLDQLLSKTLFPFDINNKYFKGKTKYSASGILKDLSEKCGAHLLVSGNAKACNFNIIDDHIRDYFQKQYALLNFNSVELQSNVEKMSCLLKCYLFEKKELVFVKKNFKADICVGSITEVQDTVDQIILQSTAHNYERIGKLDDALNTLLKINEGGLNPDTIYKRQERLAEALQRPNDAITAQTGMIKIAKQKGDKKTEIEVRKKRAKNYEKTGEKANAIDDYKKVKAIDPEDKKVDKDIIRLDNQIKSKLTQFSFTNNSKGLIAKTDQLIASNQFEAANVLLDKNKEEVVKNKDLTSLKAEVDLKMQKIDANQIPKEILENNSRLSTQIKVDKIESSKKVLIPTVKKN